MIFFFFFVWFLCQRASLCFIYITKNNLFLSLLFLFLNLIHLLLNVFEIFIMGMKPSTRRVCVCVNGQGLVGGDFVRLCPLMPMFGCWVYRFLVLCFCFHFMSFKGKKISVYCAILFIARDLVVTDQFSNISWTLVSLNFMTLLLLSITICENSEIKKHQVAWFTKAKRVMEFTDILYICYSCKTPIEVENIWNTYIIWIQSNILEPADNSANCSRDVHMVLISQ